jgi:hypothetical protein
MNVTVGYSPQVHFIVHKSNVRDIEAIEPRFEIFNALEAKTINESEVCVHGESPYGVLVNPTGRLRPHKGKEPLWG